MCCLQDVCQLDLVLALTFGIRTFVRLQNSRISTLRKDGESGGIIMGNNNQNDMNCLQIIIKIVIPRDNLHLLRNFYVILGHL